MSSATVYRRAGKTASVNHEKLEIKDGSSKTNTSSAAEVVLQNTTDGSSNTIDSAKVEIKVGTGTEAKTTTIDSTGVDVSIGDSSFEAKNGDVKIVKGGNTLLNTALDGGHICQYDLNGKIPVERMPTSSLINRGTIAANAAFKQNPVANKAWESGDFWICTVAGAEVYEKYTVTVNDGTTTVDPAAVSNSVKLDLKLGDWVLCTESDAKADREGKSNVDDTYVITLERVPNSAGAGSGAPPGAKPIGSGTVNPNLENVGPLLTPGTGCDDFYIESSLNATTDATFDKCTGFFGGPGSDITSNGADRTITVTPSTWATNPPTEIKDVTYSEGTFTCAAPPDGGDNVLVDGVLYEVAADPTATTFTLTGFSGDNPFFIGGVTAPTTAKLLNYKDNDFIDKFTMKDMTLKGVKLKFIGVKNVVLENVTSDREISLEHCFGVSMVGGAQTESGQGLNIDTSTAVSIQEYRTVPHINADAVHGLCLEGLHFEEQASLRLNMDTAGTEVAAVTTNDLFDSRLGMTRDVKLTNSYFAGGRARTGNSKMVEIGYMTEQIVLYSTQLDDAEIFGTATPADPAVNTDVHNLRQYTIS